MNRFLYFIIGTCLSLVMDSPWLWIALISWVTFLAVVIAFIYIRTREG